MRAIIHPGMHKTGTTSIQMTLAQAAPAHVYYPSETGGGHSGLNLYLFENIMPVGLRGQRTGPMRFKRQKERWDELLRSNLVKPEYDTTIYSAERLMAASPESIVRMRDFFAEYCDDIRVLAYVRPPVAYMTSALQEMVKRSNVGLELRFPKYRDLFGKFDEIFGRENVTLKKFDRAQLTDGDVLVDFFAETGIEIEKERFVTSNTGLSLEAFALLFAQRNLGDGIQRNRPEAIKDNEKFIDLVSKVGSSKLVLDPSLTDPVVAAHQEHIDWIEERLGTAMDEPAPKEGAKTIACDEDVYAAAEKARDALEAVVAEQVSGAYLPEIPPLSRQLEVLMRLY